MNPQDDDPEARIRALEQPLADKARATELGTTPYTSTGNAYLPPPLPPMPPQARGPYTPPGYGAPWAPPPRKSSAGIPWVVLGSAPSFSWSSPGASGGLHREQVDAGIPEHPRHHHPELPEHSEHPADGSRRGGPANTVTTAPSGGQISVAGVSESKTIACNDSRVSVSGVSNTVTITGHCMNVTVSGMQNQVTLDTVRSDQCVRVRQRGHLPLRLTGHQFRRIQRGPARLSSVAHSVRSSG